MTPRERIQATLAHKQPDRIPICVAARSEVETKLVKHYGVTTMQEVEAILGADIWRYATPRIVNERFIKRTNGEVKGAFGSSGPAVLHDERTFEDRFGIVQRMGAGGKYLEWVGGPFAHTDDLESFDWPTPADVVVPADLAQRAAEFRRQGFWVVGSGGIHPFKTGWQTRGFENFLCDYIANPWFVERLYERFLALDKACCHASARAGCDQLEYWGDVAMQDRMIVPPDAWRRLDKEFWRELIRSTRAIKPDITFFFHSDGNVSPIVDDLIEVGFNIINPIQPECVDPARFKQRWGKRAAMQGGGSVQRTLPFGTVADVRREVEYLLTTCAYDGGFILMASNAISFDCPVENVVAFFETGRDFDLSRLTGPPARIPDHPPCMDVHVAVPTVAPLD